MLLACICHSAHAQTAQFSNAQSTIPTSTPVDPWAVAVDGSGDIYVADYGNNRVLMETPSGGNYIERTIGSGLNGPTGVAVDGSGNVYIADYHNNRLLMETLSAGSYTQSTIGSGLNEPDSVAVDTNGNVFIAEDGNQTVVKEALSGGVYTQSTLADYGSNGLGETWGVAVDASGNVYIADYGNDRVEKLDYADPPSLSFASTAVGLTSIDSPQTVTVENVGNAALIFPVPTTGNKSKTEFSMDSFFHVRVTLSRNVQIRGFSL